MGKITRGQTLTASIPRQDKPGGVCPAAAHDLCPIFPAVMASRRHENYSFMAKFALCFCKNGRMISPS